MARRSKRAASLTVAIAGSGKLPAKAMKQQLTDFIEAADAPLKWVLPASANLAGPLAAAVDFLYEEGAEYRLVSDGTVDAKGDELFDNADEVVEVKDAQAAMVDVLTEEDNALLVLFLDEDLDGDLDLLEAASGAGVTVRDICSGMQEVALKEVEDPEPDVAEDADEAAAPAEEVATETAEPEVPAEAAVPDEIVALIKDGDHDDAIAKLKKFSREDLAGIAESLGLEVAKGVHRKTIATDVVGYVAEGFAGTAEEPAPDEPETATSEPEASDAPARPPAASTPPATPPVEGPSPATLEVSVRINLQVDTSDQVSIDNAKAFLDNLTR